MAVEGVGGRGIELFERADVDFAQTDRGLLAIAATHTQYRYALPMAVCDFRGAHPQVTPRLQQGSPRQVAEAVLARETAET